MSLIAAGVSEGPDVGRGLRAALHARLEGAHRAPPGGGARRRPRGGRGGRLMEVARVATACAGSRARCPARRWPSRRRLGGVSGAPFDTLNLGLLTGDERARRAHQPDAGSPRRSDSSRTGRDRPPGARAGGASTPAPAATGAVRPRGVEPAGGGRPLDRASTSWRCSSSSPTACRSRSATARGGDAARRLAGLAAGIVAAGVTAGGRGGGGDRSRDRALLLRGRRGGARGVRRARPRGRRRPDARSARGRRSGCSREAGVEVADRVGALHALQPGSVLLAPRPGARRPAGRPGSSGGRADGRR